MNETIRKRKSIRKYDMQPLDAETLTQIREQLACINPLYPNAPRYALEITDRIKSALFGVAAPHYLVFRSEDKEGAPENIGFLGQQMDLYFSAHGLGACWLGLAKPLEGDKENALPCLLCMAFGKPLEALHRAQTEFKRKALSEISEGEDSRLEAARLAPSGTNAQNWYFIASRTGIHCYRKNSALGAMRQKLGRIDMGIALCHIASETENFRFTKQSNPPACKGCIYMGTVEGEVKRP